MKINPYSLPSLIACVINLSLGLFVYFQDPKKIANKVFSLLMLAFGLWDFGEGLVILSTEPISALIWTKIEWTGVSFLGCIYLHLALVFPEKKRILENKFIYLLLYLPGFVFLYLTWATDWLIKGLKPTPWTTHYPFYGVAFTIYSIYFEMALFFGLYLFYRMWKTSPKKRQRRQAAWMFIATAIPIVGGSVTNVILPVMGKYIFPIASSLTAVMSILITYAIITYKEMFVTAAIASEDILSTMPDSLILLSPEGKILTVNNATLILLGYQREELVDKTMEILLPRGDPRKDFPLKELIEKGQIKDYDIFYVTKNSDKIPISFNGSVVRGEDGEVIGLVGIGRDMREIRKYIIDLEAAKSDLEKKVIERTKELEDAKESLETQVRERTKELEKSRDELSLRLEEVEKFYKVAVERELKMIELKQEIEDLKGKLKGLEKR